LRLETEMSFDKRIGKIAETLRRTFACLGHQGPALCRQFVTTCPPTTYRRYDEALRFHDFLQNHWKSTPPTPPFIVDILRYEIAVARIRVFRKPENGAVSIPAELQQRKPLVRLNQSAEVVPQEYDLRSMFESRALAGPPPRRSHSLLVVQTNRRIASVLEIPSFMVGILKQVASWTALEDVLAIVGSEPSEFSKTLQAYLKAGVLEVVQ
jgi:hypothetical protein